MNVISLLTDFGDKDNFVGVMKAVILSINPQAKIIDISHNINPQDIIAAGFLLKNSFRYFPSNTVHLVVVDPGVGTKRRPILVRTKDYYFVGPDNGVLSLALEDEVIQAIFEITQDRYFLKPVSDTFHGRDIFAPVAAYLSLGRKSENFGKRISSIKQLNFPKPRRLKNKLKGKIIYIDHFGNLITNITKDIFTHFVGDYGFKMCIAGKEITKISHSYLEGKKNEPLAIFGSFGNLEISLPKACAKEYLSADKATPIEIIKTDRKI